MEPVPTPVTPMARSKPTRKGRGLRRPLADEMAPPIDAAARERLAALVRGELTPLSAKSVRRLIRAFPSWKAAFTQVAERTRRG